MFVYLSLVFQLISLATSSIDLNEVADWANKLPVLVSQDAQRSQLWESNINQQVLRNEDSIRKMFYQIIGQTMETECSIGKKVGGRWLRSCAWFDGEKYICMDHLKEAIDNDQCLVYSYGLADDWSFDEIMAKMGCKVHSYDPTVEDKKLHPNITFHKIGLSHFNGETEVSNDMKGNKLEMAPVKRLEDFIKDNGDEGKKITYLKVDIEGSELKAIPTWLESDVLKNVQQIGIELHTGKTAMRGNKQIGKTIYDVLMAIKLMQDKYGFKLIYYGTNGCVGKADDVEKKYYSYFDIVLYKSK